MDDLVNNIENEITIQPNNENESDINITEEEKSKKSELLSSVETIVNFLDNINNNVEKINETEEENETENNDKKDNLETNVNNVSDIFNNFIENLSDDSLNDIIDMSEYLENSKNINNKKENSIESLKKEVEDIIIAKAKSVYNNIYKKLTKPFKKILDFKDKMVHGYELAKTGIEMAKHPIDSIKGILNNGISSLFGGKKKSKRDAYFEKLGIAKAPLPYGDFVMRRSAVGIAFMWLATKMGLYNGSGLMGGALGFLKGFTTDMLMFKVSDMIFKKIATKFIANKAKETVVNGAVSIGANGVAGGAVSSGIGSMISSFVTTAIPMILPILLGIIGVALLGTAMYKLWKNHKEKQEIESKNLATLDYTAKDLHSKATIDDQKYLIEKTKKYSAHGLSEKDADILAKKTAKNTKSNFNAVALGALGIGAIALATGGLGLIPLALAGVAGASYVGGEIASAHVYKDVFENSQIGAEKLTQEMLDKKYGKELKLQKSIEEGNRNLNKDYKSLITNVEDIKNGKPTNNSNGGTPEPQNNGGNGKSWWSEKWDKTKTFFGFGNTQTPQQTVNNGNGLPQPTSASVPLNYASNAPVRKETSDNIVNANNYMNMVFSHKDNKNGDFGIYKNALLAMGMIESGLNPNAKNGSFKGIYQIGDINNKNIFSDAFVKKVKAKYGIKNFNRMNGYHNSILAYELMRDNNRRFYNRTGRLPDYRESYFMHNLGLPTYLAMFDVKNGDRKTLSNTHLKHLRSNLSKKDREVFNRYINNGDYVKAIHVYENAMTYKLNKYIGTVNSVVKPDNNKGYDLAQTTGDANETTAKQTTQTVAEKLTETNKPKENTTPTKTAKTNTELYKKYMGNNCDFDKVVLLCLDYGFGNSALNTIIKL